MRITALLIRYRRRPAIATPKVNTDKIGSRNPDVLTTWRIPQTNGEDLWTEASRKLNKWNTDGISLRGLNLSECLQRGVQKS